ncbi:hypothetical protein AVEN_196374-1 [Araneus ventricosus]|uniref:Uncharacterized protein n=1 Tax=Araneus ventricosus TaxID=182803 RepID=A0A4Y2AUL9_ARAVE|nr:hypothetical protein AVEN_196374-1 [Araneus ventricosus]
MLTDLVILNSGQVTSTTPEPAPPSPHSHATSAPVPPCGLYGQGKKNCSELQLVVNISRDEKACPDDIDDAGHKVLIVLYGRKKSEETRDSQIFKFLQK